ncbi:MAG: hypothetical protein ABIJ03_03115 [Patescibacteria group bacterium]|nr:PH domain-containing protein [Patescibacteria group bacterium]
MPDIFVAKDNQPAVETASQPMPQVERVRVVHKHRRREIDDYSSVMKLEKPSSNPLSWFLPKPIRMGFSTQSAGESIILLLRQHPVTQIPWLLTVLLASLIPAIFSPLQFMGFLPANFKMAVYLGWYLMVIGFTLESFLKWFFNVYIITDERIIDVDFISLIYKNISAAKIDKIEDTTATTGGFLASIFNYGTVTIQTAAEQREFEFERVPQPNKVITLINELILEEEREKVEGRVM